MEQKPSADQQTNPLPLQGNAPARQWRIGPLAVTPTLLALIAILSVATVLRVYNSANNPQGFFADEASFGYNAYTILKHGADEYGTRFPLLFKAFGEYKLPVYTYAIVPFVAIFGLTQEAVRLTTAAFGVATVLAVFFLGRAMFRSNTVGLVAAATLAVLPWHVHYSRTGLGDIIAYPLFLVLSVTFFYKGREKPLPWWPLSAAALAMAFYSYRGGWVFMPFFIAALVALYWREIWTTRRAVLLSAALFLILLLPLGAHLLSGGTDRVQQVPILSNEARGDRTLVQAYFSYFSPSFLFSKGDDGFILRHFLPGHGEMYWVQAPLLLLGLGALLLRRKREGVLLLIGFFLYPWGGALTDAGSISSRTIHGAILFSLLTGLGVAGGMALLDRLRGQAGRLAAGAFVGAIVVMGAVEVGNYVGHYHKDYPALSAGYWGWQWGPEQIVPYFASVEGQYDRLYLDGEFNAPYIFFNFYAPDGCRKCEIGNLRSYDPTIRQLFALRPNNAPPDRTYDTKKTLHYPDGTVAFLIVEVVNTE